MRGKIILLRAGLFAGLVAAFAICAGIGRVVAAQETGSGGPSPARELPIRHPAGTKLTEEQKSGAGIFFQRCALCHLDKTFGTNGSKYCCVKSLGPRLGGLFKDMDADQERAMKDFIMNGGPTYMPAFRAIP